MTDDVETGDAWRDESGEDSDSVHSDHGEGEVFDHGDIHLDEKVQRRRDPERRYAARSRNSVGHNSRGLWFALRFWKEKLRGLRRKLRP